MPTIPNPCPACRGNRRSLELDGPYIVAHRRCELCDGDGSLVRDDLDPAFADLCLGDGWDPNPLLATSTGAHTARSVALSGLIVDNRGQHAHATFLSES